jgi:elongation factor 1-alpha
MDCDPACYKEERFKEILEETKHMLIKIGWKDEFVKNSVPFVPISGLEGENLLTKSDKMGWWKGIEVKDQNGKAVHVHTLLDVLNDFCGVPERKVDAPLRVPISSVYKVQGIGDVVAGRVEQGTLKTEDEVIFMPVHTATQPCSGKVFSIEMHHTRVKVAYAGDNVGMNVKGLPKNNAPKAGNVIVVKSDTSLKRIANFTAMVQTLDNVPNEIKPGYSPIGHVRSGNAACKINAINWKIGKETGGQKLENPFSLKANEKAEVVLEPARPLVVDTFQNCEGLARIAFLEGYSVVMLGRINKVTYS